MFACMHSSFCLIYGNSPYSWNWSKTHCSNNSFPLSYWNYFTFLSVKHLLRSSSRIRLNSRNLISFMRGVLETKKEVCHSCAVYTFLLFRILKGKNLDSLTLLTYLNLNLNWNDHCPTHDVCESYQLMETPSRYFTTQYSLLLRSQLNAILKRY
jgi:hypothetical protein